MGHHLAAGFVFFSRGSRGIRVFYCTGLKQDLDLHSSKVMFFHANIKYVWFVWIGYLFFSVCVAQIECRAASTEFRMSNTNWKSHAHRREATKPRKDVSMSLCWHHLPKKDEKEWEAVKVKGIEDNWSINCIKERLKEVWRMSCWYAETVKLEAVFVGFVQKPIGLSPNIPVFGSCDNRDTIQRNLAFLFFLSILTVLGLGKTTFIWRFLNQCESRESRKNPVNPRHGRPGLLLF
jgi:hypothetical protein